MRLPQHNPKAAAAKRREEARQAKTIPELAWIDPESCDGKTCRVVRYHLGDSRPVYLWGNPGAGKSGIAGAIAMEHARAMAAEMQGDPCPLLRGMWLPAWNLLSLVQRARTDKGVVLPGASNEVSEAHLWKRFARSSLLVVDDIGVSGLTESQYGILLRLVDVRQRLPTIYTSNLSPAELQQHFDERLASRVCCGAVIEFVGPDRRQETRRDYRRAADGGGEGLALDA